MPLSSVTRSPPAAASPLPLSDYVRVVRGITVTLRQVRAEKLDVGHVDIDNAIQQSHDLQRLVPAAVVDQGDGEP